MTQNHMALVNGAGNNRSKDISLRYVGKQSENIYTTGVT